MTIVRTAQATVSPLLRSLVFAVLGRDLQLEPAAPGQSPDLILVGLSDDNPRSRARDYLARFPAAKILLLGQSGQRAWLYERGQPPVALADLSVAALTEAVVPRFAGGPRPPAV